MFSLVPPHVDGGEGHPGRVEGGMDNGLGVSHEGEYSSVGGVAGVDIQQTGTGSGSYSICYGLYHLVKSRSIQRLGGRLVFYKPLSLFPRKSSGRTQLS